MGKCSSEETSMQLPETLAKIKILEDCIKEYDQLHIPIRHHFADGFYAREMFMPSGAVITGRIHKSEHLCIISQGEVEIVSEEFTQRVQGPFIYVSKPGAKRALYAHSDVHWTTVHRCDETTIEKVELALVTDDFDDVLLLKGGD